MAARERAPAGRLRRRPIPNARPRVAGVPASGGLTETSYPQYPAGIQPATARPGWLTETRGGAR